MARVRDMPARRPSLFNWLISPLTFRIPKVVVATTMVAVFCYVGFLSLTPEYVKHETIPVFVSSEAIHLDALDLKPGWVYDTLTYEERPVAHGHPDKVVQSACFMIGRHYAASLILLSAHQSGMVAKRLNAMEEALQTLQAPEGVSAIFDRIQNRIIHQRYDTATLVDLLTMFEPLIESYTASMGVGERLFFFLGAWSVEIQVATETGNAALLHANVDKTASLLRAMEGLDVASGLTGSMNQIHSHLKAEKLVDHDLKQLQRLIRELQDVILTHS
jgi:hypothetical protein